LGGFGVSGLVQVPFVSGISQMMAALQASQGRSHVRLQQ
jgi:hypothetical protein